MARRRKMRRSEIASNFTSRPKRGQPKSSPVKKTRGNKKAKIQVTKKVQNLSRSNKKTASNNPIEPIYIESKPNEPGFCLVVNTNNDHASISGKNDSQQLQLKPLIQPIHNSTFKSLITNYSPQSALIPHPIIPKVSTRLPCLVTSQNAVNVTTLPPPINIVSTPQNVLPQSVLLLGQYPAIPTIFTNGKPPRKKRSKMHETASANSSQPIGISSDTFQLENSNRTKSWHSKCMANITMKDLADPTKAKFIWQTANNTVKKQRHKIKYMQTKLRNERKKVKHLCELVEQVKDAWRLKNIDDEIISTVTEDVPQTVAEELNSVTLYDNEDNAIVFNGDFLLNSDDVII